MSTRVQIPMKPAAVPARVATSAPYATLQRKCACGGTGGSEGECEECKKKQTSLQRSPRGTRVPPVSSHGQDGHGTFRHGQDGHATVPPIVHDVLRSPGQALDPGARAFFEPRFGHDFGKVRIHADARAAESARAVNALAYAVGHQVVFGAGQYSPHTPQGRELLAHELAHTVQQGPGAAEGGVPGSLVVGDPAAPAEREAASTAQSVLAEGPATVTPERAGPPALRRQNGTPSPTPTAPPVQQPPAGGTPATPGQTGGTGGGGGATATCQPQGLDRAAFLATAGATTNDFGLTSLDTSAVTYPTVTTNPAKPSGVTVAPTSAALPTIPSVFTKAGIFTEGDMNVIGGGQGSCNPGKYPLKWIISPQGAQKIGEGEQEHCNDFQYAFDISLKQYADAVNALASSGRVFPNDRAVDTALTTTTGVAPANWQTVFVCLAQKSLLRDPKNKGGPSWHTPRPTRLTPTYPDCKEGRAIISAGSLPEVGQHPSSEIIKGCGEKQAPAAKAGGK